MPLDPKLEEVIAAGAQTEVKRVWTSMIGTVQSYDGSKQTADISLVSKSPLEWDDDLEIDFETLPILSDVRIVFPRGGGTSITWPLSPGDGILIVFTTLSVAEWLAGASAPAEPGDVRRHSMSGAFGVPGVGTDLQALATGADPALVLEASTIKLGANATSFIPKDDALQTNLMAIATNLTAIGSAAGAPSTYVVTPTASSKGKVE